MYVCSMYVCMYRSTSILPSPPGSRYWRLRLHGNHETVELINGTATHIIFFSSFFLNF